MKAAYSKYKSTDTPWLPTVPDEWDVVKTKFLFKERVQKGFENEPLLAATQTQGVIPKSMYEVTTVTAQKDFHLLKLVEVGDFVISLRSFQGGIEYAYYKGIISPAYTIFFERSKEQINSQYFKYLFKSKHFVNSLTLFVTGIREGQNIDYNDFRNSLLPLPPLAEQTAIANYLDAQNEKINLFISNKKKLIQFLKEQRQSIINEALRNENEKWQTRKLKFVAKVNEKALGESTSPEYEFTYLDISSVDEGGNTSEEIQKIKFANAPSRARRVVRKNDVIISTVRTYLQAITYFDGEVNDIVVSTGYAVFTPNTKIIHPDFLNYAFRKKEFLNSVTASSTGIAYPAITSTKLSNFKIILPSLDEQHKIVKHIKEETSRIDEAISRIEKEIELIKEYKQSIVAEVVTGKIKING